MKLLLSAPAVKALMELDPEHTVDLAKGAAQQIAVEIAKRLTRDAFEQRIKGLIETHMTGENWWRDTLSAKYQTLIRDEIRQQIISFTTLIEHGTIRTILKIEIDKLWADSLPALTELADALLRERFAAMFKAPSA